MQFILKRKKRFLGTFPWSSKTPIWVVMSVRLSLFPSVCVYQRGSPLTISVKFNITAFHKYIKNPDLIKMGQKYWELQMKT
jgi:hypothetical protein